MRKSHKNRYAHKVSVQKAWFEKPSSLADTSGHRGSRRAGITFEKNMGSFLRKKFKGKVLSNVWIGYESFGEVRVCSPDHLIIDVESGFITIVECKLTHIGTAYYQMVNLYLPVLKALFPGFELRGIEFCKNFDRSVSYPVGINLVRELRSTWSGFNNVHIAR